ncbi:GNAT family N-acetyltransferase [bacterium]|nr:GNAT family N-acetyltransferase [bacterium]
MKVHFSDISFQKQLVAKCSVLKNSRPYKCNLYELDSNEDKDYFTDKKRMREWENAHYWYCFIRKFSSFSSIFGNEDDNKIYALEHGNKCLGVMEVKEHTNCDLGVIYLETNPKYRGKGKKSVKYIGETMLSYLAKVAKGNDAEVFIYNSSESAYDFYISKCGFQEPKGEFATIDLDKSGIDKLIKQNESHTGRKIELVV